MLNAFGVKYLDPIRGPLHIQFVQGNDFSILDDYQRLRTIRQLALSVHANNFANVRVVIRPIAIDQQSLSLFDTVLGVNGNGGQG